MTAFMRRNYYCFQCNTAYNNPGEHKCDLKCPKCQNSTKCVKEAFKTCNDCNRVFLSDLCLQNHKANGVCSHVQCCKSCGKIYHTYKEHKCGYIECRQCKKLLPIDHKCYMQPLPRKKSTTGQLYIFYDFECMVNNIQKHVPNLCVAHKVCQDCMDQPISQQLCICGRSQMIFKGENTLEDFGAWLFSGENKGAICFAHNISEYK